ncbi:DegT/DnrJ/EryC1/StrS family aminotransferase [Nocardia gipuzkoensis]
MTPTRIDAREPSGHATGTSATDDSRAAELRLAVEGGTPVRFGRRWPTWPVYDHDTEASLLAALRSARWSLTWPSTGEIARERLFAEKFAQYNRVGYCVSVDHGSSALLIALESLDIGPGDEVIVPVLTWVAPVTAILRVGAVPILVDVDAKSGCITAESVAQAITDRTRAIIAVHLACTVADLDSLSALAADSGVTLIEDCSQSHGAEWNGHRVGTVGDLGVFSLGAAKTLAGGEGGAVITNSEAHFRRLQMLRADSRRYVHKSPAPGEAELVEDGEIMGTNYCMSELTAAVLLDQLGRLDGQNQVRAQRAAELEAIIADSDLFEAISVPPPVTARAIYEYGLQIKDNLLRKRTIDEVADALSAELGMRVYPPRVPLHRSVLLRPHTKKRYLALWKAALEREGIRGAYPGADDYRERTILFHHSALLGSEADVHDIAQSLNKVGHRYLGV